MLKIMTSLSLAFLSYLFDYYHVIILMIRVLVLALLLGGFIRSLFKKLLVNPNVEILLTMSSLVIVLITLCPRLSVLSHIEDFNSPSLIVCIFGYQWY